MPEFLSIAVKLGSLPEALTTEALTNRPLKGFDPVHNMGSNFVASSFAMVITTTSQLYNLA